MITLQPVNTTYEPFSREPEYLEANRGFIGRVPLGHVRRFLDLACGTSTVSQMLLEASPRASLNGVDYDPVQIDLAAEELGRLGYPIRRGFDLPDGDATPVVTLGVGSADDLPFPDAAFDCVTIANAIHVLPDKAKFLREVQRVLQPGGVFGFNSSFYAGCSALDTERFFYQWLREAILYIERKNEELRAQGKEPIPRKHGTTRTAFQNRWHNPDEWCAMLREHGFEIRDVNERVIMLNERCLAAVGAYGGLAEVLLSGYPVEASSMALQATAGPTLEALKMEALPRKWLEVWATKM
jgi:ubiquinone/menaquinone biosynthesis C-methylase UbiE